jgi:RNA polymerase sigma factor (sigma-70 family)
MLRNNVVDAIRRYETSQKRGGAQEISLASEQGRREGGLVSLQDGHPVGSAIRRENAASVAAVLARLPGDYRDVLQLRYWAGLSFVEIGERMGRSPDAARKLLYRAVERLQTDMTVGSPYHEGGSGSTTTGEFPIEARP